ncbi:hypothetical protein HRI_000300400 [Hibiscus trionum]|uniref:Uncharacterized protein n=1 Tax=Hibiscus trionum TaxID=183268 RepID=A0A9W7GYD3_HIBTR|nr:hypothetical protein HRI_000300400 [Hibiscus trionum]
MAGNPHCSIDHRGPPFAGDGQPPRTVAEKHGSDDSVSVLGRELDFKCHYNGDSSDPFLLLRVEEVTRV